MTANPTTELLRRLAGEPEHIIDPDLCGLTVNMFTTQTLLERIADWLDEHRHLEEQS